MRVHVLFFGRLKDIVGRGEEEAELSEGARVEDLFARYGNRFPELAGFRASVVASVNQEYAEWGATLAGGDEVGFLPPVSGGEGAKQGEDLVELVRQQIRPAEIVARVKAPQDGAVAVFDGIVRNHSGGRPTLHLEYESYEAMALGKMRAIVAEIHERFAIHRVAMVHRLGRLEIGETSVFIAVSAAHRGPAFDACRYAIETLKKTVPIWKKEFFRDGSVWAEGELPSSKTIAGSVESIS